MIATCHELDAQSGVLPLVTQQQGEAARARPRGWSRDRVAIEHAQGVTWRLLRGLAYDTADGGHWLLPCGLHSDGYSVPWFVSWLIPRWGAGCKAAVLHDMLYRYADALGVSRETADRLLCDAMIDAGIEWWRAKAVWAGTRLGGRKAWRMRRRQEREIKSTGPSRGGGEQSGSRSVRSPAENS